jgi:leucine dehydrogenase
VPGYDDHERVVSCHDPHSGLHALIAIHSTTLGPALGGCRMWPYESQREGLIDVLRLARGMSYKHAVAGTAQGGGKAVIIADPSGQKSEDLLVAFGRFVEQLEGRYITAEDVGTSVDDMTVVGRATRHVAGLPVEAGGSGDPSPLTAWGVFCGIRAAVRYQRGRDDLEGITVAVQGVGHVGHCLCRRLDEAGAKLVVADVDPASVARARGAFHADAVSPEAIYDADVDVFAPCALGGTINRQTAARLKASIVAGAANNQLSSPDVARLLAARSILYAPDYVINAGGVINISYESRGYDETEARRHTARIADTLTEVFHRAAKDGLTTAEVADRIARRKLRRA